MFFYKIFYLFFWISYHIASLFSKKASQGLKAKKNIAFENLNYFKGALWFHASSLGEFEQIKFLIQQIFTQFPTEKIVVSFFSPSGFEASKNFKFAHHITYLPLDSISNAQKWLEALSPKIVYWVRYDFWLHMLLSISRQNIPLILLNGVFWPKYLFFYLPILKKSLSCFQQIYCINSTSLQNLKKIGFEGKLLPDTRFDRMHQVAIENFTNPIIDSFSENSEVLIAGSTWEKCEQMLLECVQKLPNIKLIIAPHSIAPSRIEFLTKLFPLAILYSKSSAEEAKNAQILILDTIGMLTKVYRKATWVYVGGGFDKVVHSTLEPLAYGVPIFCGPHTNKSEECTQFIQDGWVQKIQNAEELIAAIQFWENAEKRRTHQIKAKDYFHSQCGSVEKLLENLKNLKF